MVDWEAEGKVMPDFDKLENQKRQGAQREGDLPLWAARQQKVFTNWINNKVCDRPLSVCDLFVDLQDGTVLYGLLEVLSKQSLAVLGKVKPERNKIKKIANMNIVWKYLGNTVKLVGIGPTDIVDGNVTLTLGMIWSLIVFFMALDLGDAGDGLTVLKKRIMEWMTRRTKDFPDVEVSNFTTSLADGRVLLAILNDYDPSQSPYEPSSSPADNLRRAFEDFQRLYGVGSILDPDDPQCCEDEKANITYLAELMKAMPEHEDDGGEGGGRRGRKGIREAATVVNTRQAAIKISEDSFPETVVGRLRELCAFGPGDGAACASRVAEMMRDAGLDDVKVVEPSQDREDASMRRDPIVVGEKAGPPGSPTVLFYASYGTVDESSEAGGAAEGSGSPTQGSTINDDIERWASDPLCLTPTKRPSSSSPSPSQAAGTPKGGERLAARGSAQDKANVVCQIAAVEAMLEGGAGLPCGVKVVVGATPPPGSLSGDAPLEVADRLADFLRAHPSLAGLPDLVVVSEPAGSRLAPDKNALLVGCRGFAFLEVAVSTFEDGSGHRRGCSDYGGPLIDPARVLANIVASLHHPETGELSVEGVSDLAPKEGEALAEGIGDLRYGEGQLRRDTGYSPEVACARGVCYKPGGSSPDKPTTTTTLASVAEQLALLPAVTVTSISTTRPNSFSAGGGGSLLGSRFPATATAGIHMCLPPGAEYASAVRAFQSHCAKHAPHGAKVRFDKVLGRAGWLAPTSGSPMVSGVLASLREEDGGEAGGPVDGGGRETVLASDPGFSAIPSAFARALPDSAVVGLGVNDPESKGGAANESVLVDDLKGFVRSAVRLVHGVAESGGKKEKAGSSSGGVKEGAGEDAPTAYSNRFIDDLDRRNAVNQLRGGKLSNVSSPAGSANTTPRGTNSRGITHRSSGAGGSPVRSRSPASRSPSRFSTLERNLEREGGGGGAGGFSAGGVGGGPLTPNAKHPLSPNRPPSSATTAGLSPADSASIAELLQSSPLAPRLPPAPSAAMAAFAAAALGDAAGGGGGRGGAGGLDVMTPPPPGGGAGMAGDEDDDKVGGGTPETVLAEINELRADPKGYAAKLEALQEFYDKGMYQSPTGPPVQTTEGVKPLLEVVTMLKTTESLAPLESKEGMQQAAADHVKDLAETSRTGHSGSDGSGAADRMNRYGQFFQVAGEVCTYFDATAEGIVAQLLVSDGERSRHNRKALLAAHFKVCGIAIGTHPTVGAACVITLAGGYGPRPLSRSADVVCEAGAAPSAEFREVLESIPVPQITEEVNKCVKVGMEVQLQYTPGSIKCTFVQASGARKSMGCKWA